MSDFDAEAFETELQIVIEHVSSSLLEVGVSRCETFIKAYPERAEGYYLLGLLLYNNGRAGDARSMMEKAHDIDPDLQEAAFALSALFGQAGQLRDALYFSKLALSLEERAHLAETVPPEFRNFIEATAKSVPHVNYVNGLYAFDQQDFTRTIHQCELDLAIYPGHEPTMILQAKACIGIGDFGRAAEVLQAVVDQNGDCENEVRLLLAEALIQLGLFDNARQYIDKVTADQELSVEDGAKVLKLLSRIPGGRDAQNSLLQHLEKTVLKPQEPYYEYLPSVDGKIRIGILSDQFYNGFIGQVLREFMLRMDRNTFVVYGYKQNRKWDATSDFFATNFKVFRETADIDDKTLSLIMQRDGIDVLIDMCGFEDQHRLELLARQPGVTRASWLSSPQGLALSTIDHVFVSKDDLDSVQSAEPLVVESGVLARAPLEGYLPPNPSPAKSSGHVTFGAALDLAAMALGDGELMVKVLQDNPDARLKLNMGGHVSPVSLSLLNQHFEPFGLQERIDLYSPEPNQSRGAFFNEVDVYLASCLAKPDQVLEALHMGVPCVMRTRDDLTPGLGLSVLRQAGRGEWVFADDATYLEAVQGLASDISGLETLRATMRDALAASPVHNMDNVALKVMYAVRDGFVKATDAAVQSGEG